MSEQEESTPKRKTLLLIAVRDGIESSVCDMDRICKMGKDDAMNTIIGNINLMIEMSAHFDGAFNSCKVKTANKKGVKSLVVSYDNFGKETSFSIPYSEGDGSSYPENVVNGMLSAINIIIDGGA